MIGWLLANSLTRRLPPLRYWPLPREAAARMIESSMYFGIGLLFGALIGLVLIPLIHGRAVRLTTRRLEAVLPESMAEVQAEKDLLRAEFAMSTRRLEMTVEQLVNKTNQITTWGIIRRKLIYNQIFKLPLRCV